MGGLKVADFFCGAGGFSEGFRQKGFDVVFSLDNWAPAKATHDLNHPDCKCVLMDILEIKTPQDIDKIVPNTDIIVGSPPCVSFSGSNKAGKADKSLGIKLIEAYLRIVLWKLNKGTLKYWIMENVPNSQFYVKEEYTWKELGLPGNGPNLKIPVREILVASDYGAPQGRKRFVCGNYPVPERTHSSSNYITNRKVLESLGNPNDKPKSVIVDPVHGFKLPSNDLTDHYYDTLIPQYEWEKAKRLKVDHGYMGKMDFPERLDRLSRTIMATMSSSTRESIIYDATKNGKHIGYRTPTIREAASMMGFPINYQFTGSNEGSKYKQIGNAVCVPMSAALAEAILVQEKRKVHSYIVLPKRLPPVNLNGRKKVLKQPKPRIYESKFVQHIPYLKQRSFRVELDNKLSDFSNKKIVWRFTLHHGSGSKAEVCDISKCDVEKLIKLASISQNFISSIKKITSQFDLHTDVLHNAYLSHKNANSPEALLEAIKKQIDMHVVEDKEIIISHSEIPMRVNSIPGKIIAGMVAANLISKKL